MNYIKGNGDEGIFVILNKIVWLLVFFYIISIPQSDSARLFASYDFYVKEKGGEVPGG